MIIPKTVVGRSTKIQMGKNLLGKVTKKGEKERKGFTEDRKV